MSYATTTVGATLSTSPVPEQTKTTIGFVSLGCPKNLVDSEVMMGLLDRAGARITTCAEDADVIVVNTCSFIDSAKQESVDAILEMAGLKSTGRVRRLIVAGCLVERYRDEIRKNIPEVDAVVGTGELEEILAAAGIQQAVNVTPGQGFPFRILGQQHSGNSSHKVGTTGRSAAQVQSRFEGQAREAQGRFSRKAWDGAQAVLPAYLYDESTPRVLSTRKSSAYIKIAEGCDHPCAFCIIPQLRGKFRSRHFESVITEARALARQGIRELTLVGQDTTCYGEDLGIKHGLALLLERLAEVDGLHWIRFLYAYPNKVTGKLLETVARHENICSYLDVPLQHAAPNVLKRMKRGAGADIFLRSVEKMRATIPNLALRTTFIVGFPGETESDFELLCDFVRQARFDWLGVFSYSDEDGSAAFALDEKVPLREIERRRKKLMSIQRQISRRRNAELVGCEFELLAEGPSEETELLWEGRTFRHAPEIDGKVFINDFGEREQLVSGEFYRCEITESHDYDLVARISN